MGNPNPDLSPTFFGGSRLKQNPASSTDTSLCTYDDDDDDDDDTARAGRDCLLLFTLDRFQTRTGHHISAQFPIHSMGLTRLLALALAAGC